MKNKAKWIKRQQEILDAARAAGRGLTAEPRFPAAPILRNSPPLCGCEIAVRRQTAVCCVEAG